ncbi:MAG: hypothetical protein FWF96_05140 [Kiritimatiellaeota bacterium]|nr:hypothetical protein [Kiritimatiellota bacterium]
MILLEKLGRVVCCVVCAGALARAQERVEMREITCRVRLPMTAVAERSETLNNPLDWPVIMDYVEDGAWVDEGGRVIAFDVFPVSNEWRRLQTRMAITQAELALQLKDADNTLAELSDRLRAEEDKLKVEEAALERLRRLPETNDVVVAEGRVRVAALTALAESNTLVRAAERLERGFISETAYERQRSAWAQSQARLEQSRNSLAALMRGAEPLDIEQRELTLENQRLALTNLIDQIEDTRAIVELRKQSARVRARSLDRQISERERDLREVNFTAPKSGFVTYTKSFLSRYISGTDRMWRRFTFGKIPDMETLVFRGGLPEQYRRFFRVGDAARLRVVGRLGEEVAGRVAIVGELARDSSEREETGWGDPNHESGVKVYDVTVRPDALADWMRLGVHAEVWLERSRPLLAPAVRADYLIHRDGQNYLYLNGALRQVSGSVMEGWFVLTETNLLGMAVSQTPPQTKKGAATDIPKGIDMLFETSGELVPLDSSDVRVKPIMGWQKVAWLQAEDSLVTNNQVICTLDEKETRDRLTELENQLEERATNRNVQEQAIEVMVRKHEMQRVTASNSLRVAQVRLDLVRRGADENDLIAAQLDLILAEITEKDALRDHEALKNRPQHLVSPQELVRAERAARKAALQRERAEIALDKLRQKPRPVELARAEAALAEARLNEETGRIARETELYQAETDLQWNKRQEQNATRRHEEISRNIENLTLRAPRDGTLRYHKSWTPTGWAKVAPGVNVGSGNAPVYIADMGRMEIRAEAPERFYLDIKKGMGVKVQISAVSDEFFDGEVDSIELLFGEKKQANVERGLYSGHEPLGETIFTMRVTFTLPDGMDPKAGAIARIVVPKPKGAK